MANAINTYEVSAAIKSSADKFYHFIKYDLNKLVTIFPASFTGVEVLEGTDGAVGCIKLWKYTLGVLPLTAKELTEAINDEGKSITIAVVEGDLMLLYKSFKFTMTVSDGFIKWTFAFEKLTPLSPIPEVYGVLAITATALIDAYLHLNN